MLRPEVAEQFELSTRSTLVHVPQLGRDYDLTRITLAQAEELVAVPGFDRLRRKELPLTNAGPVARTTGPAKGKKKKGA
ncbi:MAG: hypothetical protein ACRYFX_19660 [Janthinobacterium lividum]